MFKIYKKLYWKTIRILATTSPLVKEENVKVNVQMWHKKLLQEVLEEL